MNRLTDIFSKIARSSGLFMVLVIVCLYFTFYAVKGERGLFRYWNLKQEISQAKQLQEKYDSEKNAWEDKVGRMKSEHLDLDMLDEQARLVLNMVGEKEFVILDSDLEE